MIDTSTGWDHIDEIAVHLLGYLLQKNPELFAYLKSCAKSENFWKRRVSLIAQIKLFKTDYCDKALFFSICKEQLSDREFFIRKAIGWGLRELSKSDPSAVYGFIYKYKDHMSGLTFREGSRRLPEHLRQKLN
jgi:3-methyladenine DNA glycosylase AlkD